MPAAIPDPSDVIGFPAGNPRLKIVRQKDGLCVVEVERRRDPLKGRTVTKRTTVGKIVDGRYYTLEEFRRRRDGTPRVVRPEIPEIGCRLAGEVMLFDCVAHQMGLWKAFDSVWGEYAADEVVSLASFFLTTERNSLDLYVDWRQTHIAPFDSDLSPKMIMDLYSGLGMRESLLDDFFSAFMAGLDVEELFALDASAIAASALQTKDVQNARGKKTGSRREVGLVIFFDRESRLPVRFRILPGSPGDVSRVPEALFEFEKLGDRPVAAAVLDPEDLSKEKLLRFAKASRNVFVPAQTDASWIQGAVDEALPKLEDYTTRLSGPVRGCTVSVKATETGEEHLWVHVFRDLYRQVDEQCDFLADVEAFEFRWNRAEDAGMLSRAETLRWFHRPAGAPGACGLEEDQDAINEHCRRRGLFASVSSIECTAKLAFETWGERERVRRCFEAGRTLVGMPPLCSYDEGTMQGRFLVSFAALAILCELNRRMSAYESRRKREIEDKVRWKTLADEATLEAVLSKISPVKVFFSGTACRLADVTDDQRELADRLGCPGLFDEAPGFFLRQLDA